MSLHTQRFSFFSRKHMEYVYIMLNFKQFELSTVPVHIAND